MKIRLYTTRLWSWKSASFLNCVLKECDIFHSGGDVEWTNLPFRNFRWHFRVAALKTKRLIVRTPNYRVLCSSPRKAIFALWRQRNLSTLGRSEGFRCADVWLDAVMYDSLHSGQSTILLPLFFRHTMNGIGPILTRRWIDTGIE